MNILHHTINKYVHADQSSTTTTTTSLLHSTYIDDWHDNVGHSAFGIWIGMR